MVGAAQLKARDAATIGAYCTLQSVACLVVEHPRTWSRTLELVDHSGGSSYLDSVDQASSNWFVAV